MWTVIKNNYEYQNELNKIVKLSYLNLDEFKNMYPQNWIQKKLIYKNKDKIISYCNLYLIKKTIVDIIYIPGGIEGVITEKLLIELKNYIAKEFRILHIIFIDFHQHIDSEKYLPKSFLKVINIHETRMVMKKKLENVENLKKSYSKNWRHNYNRSKKGMYIIQNNLHPDIDELLFAYNQMSKLKKFKINISRSYLTFIFNFLNDKIIHYEVRENRKLIAFRTCVYNGDYAWDLLACSNLESKKNYCTYGIMNKIFEDLILKQVSNYDLSGVDKKNNLGVYNFKKGTGSLEFLKVGEYLEAPFFIFKLFFFCIIFLKRIFIK